MQYVSNKADMNNLPVSFKSYFYISLHLSETEVNKNKHVGVMLLINSKLKGCWGLKISSWFDWPKFIDVFYLWNAGGWR